jgi:hypothetical protein
MSRFSACLRSSSARSKTVFVPSQTWVRDLAGVERERERESKHTHLSLLQLSCSHQQMNSQRDFRYLAFVDLRTEGSEAYATD